MSHDLHYLNFSTGVIIFLPFSVSPKYSIHSEKPRNDPLSVEGKTAFSHGYNTMIPLVGGSNNMAIA
jgi:hypothetical protein